MREEIFSYPVKENSFCSFHLQIAGVSYCDASYRIERNNSPLYAFVYVKRGSGSLYINSCIYRPVAGDVFILHKGSKHVYYSDEHDPWILYWFVSEGSLVEHLLQAYRLENTYHVRECPVLELFEEILPNHITCTDSKRFANRYPVLFHEMIIKISALAADGSKSNPPSAMAIKNYLDDNAENNVNIKELSKLVYKSPSQVIRLFKKVFGVSPYDYLMKRKIDIAKLLLQSTNIPIKEIAFRLKFSDEHYFSNYFKAKVGLPPSLYRRQLGNK